MMLLSSQAASLRSPVTIANLLILLTFVCMVFASASAGDMDTLQQRCAYLEKAMHGAWPETSTRITDLSFLDAGPAPRPPIPFPAGPAVTIPAHCEVIGSMQERTGIDGQNYAIRFHVRLPEEWNGRFLFEGGGGTDGILGDAIGRVVGTARPALAQGYAVLSQDSGHDNATNTVPEKGGVAAFGLDPEARANYGGKSLKHAADAALALIEAFYGAPPEYRYFAGCSVGGKEGMYLSQRNATLFDGIIAVDPGISLPRIAIAEAWDTQQFASLVSSTGSTPLFAKLAGSFSDSDLEIAAKGVLQACDADDGLVDGIVGAFTECTSNKVLPELDKLTCSGKKQGDCLSSAQVDVLRRIHTGVHNNKGVPLYTGFPWDAGWLGQGWRIWKIGTSDGRIPAINVVMGAPALAAVFTTPPVSLGTTPQDYFNYMLGYDFDRDAPHIYETTDHFPRSSWEDIAARSTDLTAFRAHGGKLIIIHGVSDPVFSINDTLAWYREVNDRNGGKAQSFVRVFPVPGMAHCRGGPATDNFDGLSALVNWVETKDAPAKLIAHTGPGSAWPQRTRLLCPYPLVARYKGSGDPDSFESFHCEP